MRFLIDQDLSAVLCDWLAAKGHHAEHIRLLGLRDASDNDLIRRVRQTGAVLITRDFDFTPRAGGDSLANWFQIIWVRLGNVTNEELIASLEPKWPDAIIKLERGDPIVEIDGD